MSKADTTRLTILQRAFELVYKRGYQATSIDDIIAHTQMTKGAFFYHFRNKDEMGLAMIYEVMYPGMKEVLLKPLEASEDPVVEIHSMMKTLLLKAPFFQVKYGCPAVNLAEEMAPLNKPFNRALLTLMNQWQEAIRASLLRGRAAGRIRKDVNAAQVACFIVAGYGGIRNMGKMLGVSCYHTYLKELGAYLRALS